MSVKQRKERIAMIVAGCLAPLAIYFAFWQINWGDHHGSLTSILLPVAFSVMAPSALGSIIAALRFAGAKE